MIDEKKIKPCPFCGGDKIDYSVKTTGRWERKYHVAMYCKKCNCYGARTLITPTEECRWDVEKNEEYKKLAIEAWNDRTVQPQGIDKDRLIKTFTKWRDAFVDENHNGYVLMQSVIEEIQAQPQTGWIPCSERLPKEDGKYLCSYGDGYVGTFCFATNLYLLAPFNFGRYRYNEHKGFYECDSTYGYYEIENVTAWQPLPQPYKESE